MKCELFLVILGLAAIKAMPFEVVQTAEGTELILVPLHRRVARQTVGGGITANGKGGVTANVNVHGTLAENDKHRLDGSAFVQRDFRSKAPLTTGGQLDYTHKPSGSDLSVDTSNTSGFGTDLNVNGRYNIYSGKNADVGLTGHYQRHYGGSWGTGRPNYGVGIGGRWRF